MSASSPTPAPGLVVGDRYRIEELIGQGGFGAVYRATQLNLGRAVALKVILPELVGDDGLFRFQREAELAQRLGHPNTVRVLDFGRAPDGSPFLVFELLSGRTLESEIVRAHGLPASRVARVAAQVLRALMEAHGVGIVHRDIKPANVFLCDFPGEPDFVKILDFGIAVGQGSRSLTRQGQVVGTPRYMAPEQVTGEPVTFAADLYALGLLMSEALSGKPLFEGMTSLDIAREKTADGPVPHAPEALKSPLGAVILRATQRQPERRYASAAEMLDHIESAMPAARSSRDSRNDGASSGSGERGASSGGGGGSGATTALAPLGAAGWSGGAANATSATSPAFTGPAPVVPPAPGARKGGKRSGPPWVLIGMLGGVAALLGVMLFILVPKRKTATDVAQPGAAEPTESRPVVLTGMLSNSGWIVHFHLLEKPSVIEYKHPGDVDFVSLGTDHQMRDPDTNQPSARTFVILDDLRGQVPFEVRYRTKGGAQKGPFNVIFDVAKESVASVKSQLATTPQWVSFGVTSKRRMCYFSTLLGDKYAFTSIRYGFDSEVADKALRFTPSEGNRGSTRDDQSIVDVPEGVQSVTVEVTYLDGTKDRKRFPFKAESVRPDPAASRTGF